MTEILIPRGDGTFRVHVIPEEEVAGADLLALLRELEHDEEHLTAIPSHTAPKDVESTAWNKPTLTSFTDKPWGDLGAEEKTKISRAFVWKTASAESFAELQLPHHDANSGNVVWNGVRASMASLLGARGEITIPSADRQEVWNHLARHYQQFDREAPGLSQRQFSEEDFGPDLIAFDVTFLEALQAKGLTLADYYAALQKNQLRGYAAVWGRVEDRHDVLEPGAFTKTLKEKELREFKFLWQHFSWEPIGITKSLEEDNFGLLGVWEFSKSAKGQDARLDASTGTVDAMSIGFNIKAFRVQPVEDDDGNETEPLRIITELELFETSLVTFPAAKRARVLEVNSERVTCDACIEVNGACFPCTEPQGHFPIIQHRAAPSMAYQIAWGNEVPNSAGSTNTRARLDLELKRAELDFQESALVEIA